MQDEFCHDLIQYIENDVLPPTKERKTRCLLREMHYNVINSCLHLLWQPIPSQGNIFHIRLVVPKGLRQLVMDSAHRGHCAHTGINKMISVLQPNFVWPGMYTDVLNYVSKCDDCLKGKKNHKPEQVERSLYALTYKPFQTVHIDILGPLTLTQRKNMYVCACTCRYSGYLIAWAMKNQEAKTVAMSCYNNLLMIFGTPDIIISDNGPCFIAQIWKELGQIMNIKMVKTAPYMPTSNARVERSNLSMASCMRAICSANPHKWDLVLPSIVQALNSSVHYATGLSANMLVFGRHLQSPEQSLLNKGAVTLQPRTEVIEEILRSQQIAHKQAMKSNEEQALKRKEKHDASIRPSNVTAGSVVYWKKVPRPNETQCAKLMQQYAGPYIVVQRHDKGLVTLKALATNIEVPRRVPIVQLKHPSHYHTGPTRAERFESEAIEANNAK